MAVPAVFLIVLPLVLGHEEGWPWWVPAGIAAGLALAVAFVAVERRVAARGGDPLLNLDVLGSPGIVSGLGATAITMIAYGGFLFSLSLHLQSGLGDSALRAGLTFAPAAAAFGLCGFYWRKLPQRWQHVLAPAGLGAAAVAEVFLALTCGRERMAGRGCRSCCWCSARPSARDTARWSRIRSRGCR